MSVLLRKHQLTSLLSVFFKQSVLGKWYYATFALWHDPSIRCLSVVCDVVALYTDSWDIWQFLHHLIA